MSHTPICHQPRVGPCGGATIYYRKRWKENPKAYWSCDEKPFHPTTTTRRFHVVLPSPRSLKLHITESPQYNWFLASENIDNRSALMNHLVNAFVALGVDIKRRYFFASPPIARQISFLFGIREQFINTCSDICLLASQKQFEWSNPGILQACRNFASPIFSVRIWMIRLLFVFTKSACYFILDLSRLSTWAGVESVNWPW